MEHVGEPRKLGFLLIPGFALMSYSCAVEPYRAANTLAGRELYRWAHISPNGGLATASNGVSILPDQGLEAPVDVDELFVCAGGNTHLFDSPPTLAWLRSQGHRTGLIGGVAGGPVVLAMAGLLRDYRCTMHWEYIPGFRERFPTHTVTGTRFEIDRGRATSAGGAAALEMMVSMISDRHGPELATAIRDWFLHTRSQAADQPQRMSAHERHVIAHPTLIRALDLIEKRIEEPIGRDELSRMVGLSIRQVERVFRQHLGCTIGQHYLAKRLERAQLLLRQTNLSILEVAVATGFASGAAFSRSFRDRFGRTPRRERDLARGCPYATTLTVK